MDSLLTRPSVWTVAPAAVPFLPLWVATLSAPKGPLFALVGFVVTLLLTLFVQLPKETERGFYVLLLTLSFCLLPLQLYRLYQPVPLPSDGDALLVTELRETSWGERALLRDERGYIWSIHQEDLIPARWLTGKITATVPTERERYYSTRGAKIDGYIKVKSTKYLPHKETVHSLLARYRYAIARRAERLPTKMATLVKASFTGLRDVNGAEDYRRWGAAHLIALSGWHVGIAAGLFLFVFGRTVRGTVLSSLCLIGYLLLGGSGLSAARATVMSLILLWGSALQLGGNRYNSLAVALLVTLLIWPFAPFSLSWQLSALATAVVICVEPWTIKGAILTPIVLWITTAPLIAPLQGGLSLSSLVIGFGVVFFSLLYLPCLALALPTLLGVPFAHLFASFGERVLNLWGAVADWFVYQLPIAYLPPKNLIILSLALIFWLFTGRLTDKKSTPLRAAAATGLLWLLLKRGIV